MNDSTTSEISNLFQELIVSKVKDEIDLLKQDIDEIKENNGRFEEKVDKLPKPSLIRQIAESEQTKIIEFIEKVVKNSKSEKYMMDIVAYLKKQYGFADKKTLCMVLDELQLQGIQINEQLSSVKGFVENNKVEEILHSLIDYIKKQYEFTGAETLCSFMEDFSKNTEGKITNLINGQGSFLEKYVAIELEIKQFKETVLDVVDKNAEFLEQLQKQLIETHIIVSSCAKKTDTILAGNIDEIGILKIVQSLLDSISVKTDGTNAKIDEVLRNTNSESELILLLRSISANIDYGADSLEESGSVKKDFIEINNRINELIEKKRSQDDDFIQFQTKYENNEKIKNKILKVLIIGNAISLIGIIVMIILLLF